MKKKIDWKNVGWRFLGKKKNRIVLNVIAIAMMLTGPILMILPGPQVISWLGLALFIYINYTWLKKFKWFRKIENRLNKWNALRKLKNRKLLRKISYNINR